MNNIDVAIVGGSMAGCFAAVKAAKMGLNVALIEKSTLLGKEFSAYHRPWISEDGIGQYAEELKPFFMDENEKIISNPYNHETPLFLGTIRKQLLEMLLENNVQVLFMSQVAGVLVSEKSAEGLLLANKYGLEILRASTIIDMTEGRNVIGLLEEEINNSCDIYKVYYTVEFDDVVLPSQEYIDVPASFGICGNKIKFHFGKKEPGNGIIEFSYLFSPEEDSIFMRSRIENKSRMIASELIIWLHKNHESFHNATPVNIGYESYIERNKQQDIFCRYKDIYTINGILPWEFGWSDIFTIKREAEDCIERIGIKTGKGTDILQDRRIISGKSVIPLMECKISQIDDDGLNIALETVKFNIKEHVKNKYNCDILIAGGGTGGIMTGIAAGGKNKKTLLVEMHQDFGGTRTQGFVSGYWHGYRGGFTKHTDEKIEELTEMMTGRKKQLNRVARMLFYHSSIADTGCKFLLSAQICDTILDNKSVRGGLAVDDRGLLAIESKVTVDSTGDGDVAYFAEAKYSFGDVRDGNVQSFSMWGMEKNKGKTVHESYFLKDVDVISQEKYSELLRGIYQSHRINSPYYFASMLTVREGRRIHGEYMLNLNDILDGKEFEDCISVALCPLDSHGRKSSWFSLLGLFAMIAEKEIQVRIPYRCCIPEGFHGILVTAKAISATRDAACLCRMTADIQNLGYACGLAAVMAVEGNCDIRDIPLGILQNQLQEEGILPSWALEKKAETVSIEKNIALLKDGKLEAFFNVLLKPEVAVVPLLAKEFMITFGDEKINIAKALAWYGSGEGSELLIDKLKALVDKGITSYHAEPKSKKDSIIFQELEGTLNDYWHVNQLIVLLGMSGDRKALEIICDIIEKTEAGGPADVKTTPYHAGRVDIQRIPMYERIVCICFAVERLADRKAIPAMEKLIAQEHIGGRYISENIYDLNNFFSAYLELKIASVLARCGSKIGTGLVIDYLKDIHYILRKYAYDELKSVSNMDFGMNIPKWKQWLKQAGSLEAKSVCAGTYLPDSKEKI